MHINVICTVLWCKRVASASAVLSNVTVVIALGHGLHAIRRKLALKAHDSISTVVAALSCIWCQYACTDKIVWYNNTN
jgi:hypothetical protein